MDANDPFHVSVEGKLARGKPQELGPRGSHEPMRQAAAILIVPIIVGPCTTHTKR